jgi:hypothetical protein
MHEHDAAAERIVDAEARSATTEFRKAVSTRGLPERRRSELSERQIPMKDKVMAASAEAAPTIGADEVFDDCA